MQFTKFLNSLKSDSLKSSSTDSAISQLSSSIIDDMIQLEEVIGESYMSVVYKATDLKLNRNVVVKFLKRSISENLDHDGVLREASLLAALNHQNIAKVYRFDNFELKGIGKVSAFTMEYIEGLAIDEYCKVNNVNFKDKIKLLIQATSAISHSHNNNVIHADIKPSNVIVTNEGEIKVIDFGIARHLQEDGNFEHNAAYQNSLSWVFASPEQKKHQALTHQSDIYSLAGLFLFLLKDEISEDSFRIPDHQSSIKNIFKLHRKKIKNFKDKLRIRDIEHILLQALSVDIIERQSTSHKLLQELEATLTLHPIYFKQKKTVKSIKWLVRSPLRGLLAVLLLLTIAISFVQVNLKNQSLKVENETGKAMISELENTLFDMSPNKTLSVPPSPYVIYSKTIERIINNSYLKPLVKFKLVLSLGGELVSMNNEMIDAVPKDILSCEKLGGFTDFVKKYAINNYSYNSSEFIKSHIFSAKAHRCGYPSPLGYNDESISIINESINILNEIKFSDKKYTFDSVYAFLLKNIYLAEVAAYNKSGLSLDLFASNWKYLNEVLSEKTVNTFTTYELTKLINFLHINQSYISLGIIGGLPQVLLEHEIQFAQNKFFLIDRLISLEKNVIEQAHQEEVINFYMTLSFLTDKNKLPELSEKYSLLNNKYQKAYIKKGGLKDVNKELTDSYHFPKKSKERLLALNNWLTAFQNLKKEFLEELNYSFLVTSELYNSARFDDAISIFKHTEKTPDKKNNQYNIEGYINHAEYIYLQQIKSYVYLNKVNHAVRMCLDYPINELDELHIFCHFLTTDQKKLNKAIEGYKEKLNHHFFLNLELASLFNIRKQHNYISQLIPENPEQLINKLIESDDIEINNALLFHLSNIIKSKEKVGDYGYANTLQNLMKTL